MKTVTILSEYNSGNPVETNLMFSRLVDRAEDSGLRWNISADGSSLSVGRRDLTQYSFTVWRAGRGDYGVNRYDGDAAYFCTAREAEACVRGIMRDLKNILR